MEGKLIIKGVSRTKKEFFIFNTKLAYSTFQAHLDYLKVDYKKLIKGVCDNIDFPVVFRQV
jgi:hypothetical protein